MDRVKKIFRLIHLLLWVLFILLVRLQLGGKGDAHWLSTFAGFIAACLYVFYSHFYLLTRHTGTKRSYWLWAAGIVVTGPLPFLLFHHEPLDFGYYLMHLSRPEIS